MSDSLLERLAFRIALKLQGQMTVSNRMRPIPTRIHGLLDYSVALLLIVWPLMASYRLDAPEAIVPIVLGAGTVGFSLFTDYELALVPLIPMPVHLGLDMASGGLLVLSPWLFGFVDRGFAPHVTIGLLEIGVAMMTATVAGRVRASATGQALIR